MAFEQFKLDKSINQSRGIFDKYVYQTDDAIAAVEAAGYFAKSRFAIDDDWVGSVIECQCLDGYIFGTIGSDGSLNTLFDSRSGGSGMPISPSGSEFYVAESSSWFIATEVLKADREIVVRGTDNTIQEPSVQDTPLQVTWGPAVGTGSDPVNIDANGNIFINEADNYHFRISLQYGRTGGGGTAWIYLRFLVNGVQAGVTVLSKLNNANSDFPYQAELTADLPAGVTITGEIWRGSEGTNDGGLFANTPALAGAGSNPSADIIVSRYRVKKI